MAFDQKRMERLAKATASDALIYNKDRILTALKEDNFYESVADVLEESRKNFEARNKEAAQTNLLERAIVDTIIAEVGTQDKFPIF